MTESITITLPSETVKKLDSLMNDRHSTYIEIISEIINDACAEEDTITHEEYISLKNGLDDIKKGRTYTSKEISGMFPESVN